MLRQSASASPRLGQLLRRRSYSTLRWSRSHRCRSSTRGISIPKRGAMRVGEDGRSNPIKVHAGQFPAQPSRRAVRSVAGTYPKAQAEYRSRRRRRVARPQPRRLVAPKERSAKMSIATPWIRSSIRSRMLGVGISRPPAFLRPRIRSSTAINSGARFDARYRAYRFSMVHRVRRTLFVIQFINQDPTVRPSGRALCDWRSRSSRSRFLCRCHFIISSLR